MSPRRKASVSQPDTLTVAEFKLAMDDLKVIVTVTKYGKPIGRWIPEGVAVPMSVLEPRVNPAYVSPNQSQGIPTPEQMKARARYQQSVLSKAFPQRGKG